MINCVFVVRSYQLAKIIFSNINWKSRIATIYVYWKKITLKNKTKVGGKQNKNKLKTETKTWTSKVKVLYLLAKKYWGKIKKKLKKTNKKSCLMHITLFLITWIRKIFMDMKIKKRYCLVSKKVNFSVII